MSWPILLWGLFPLFFKGLTGLERSQSIGSWQMPQFFRKGKKEDPGNYGPFSITLVPGKIMEEVILGVTENNT